MKRDALRTTDQRNPRAREGLGKLGACALTLALSLHGVVSIAQTAAPATPAPASVPGTPVPAPAAVPAKAAPTVTAAGSPTVGSVRIVCLAEDASVFGGDDLRLLQALAGLADLLTKGGEKGEKSNSAAIAKLVKEKYPQVGRWNFIPLGSGFVVNHGKYKDNDVSYIVTNWHVSVACPQARLSTREPGKLEATGLSLGVLEPLQNEVRPIIADRLVEREKPDAKGNPVVEPLKIKVLCRDNKAPCDYGLPADKRVISTSKRDAMESNLLMYVPDLAVLQTRERINLPVQVLGTSKGLNANQTLEIQGFPQIAMQITQSDVGARRELALPVLTKGTYSRTLSLDNNAPNVALEDVVKSELLILSAQIQPGNSGGPVFLDGKVVGVATATFTSGGKQQRSDMGTEPAQAASPGVQGLPAGYGLAVTVEEVKTILNWFSIAYASELTPATPAVDSGNAAKTDTNKASVDPAKVTNEIEGKPQPSPRSPWLQYAPMIAAVLAVAALGLIGAEVWRRRQMKAIAPQPLPVAEPVPMPAAAPAPVPTPATNAPRAAVTLRASHGLITGSFNLPTPNGGMTMFVGRDPKSCQVVYPNDQDVVSSVHLCFSWNPNTHTLSVRDMSSNGTFLNGTKVEREANLKNGDIVELGASNMNRFTVEIHR